MANLVPVKKEQHQDLKVSEKRGLGHIAGQHIIPISASEFAQGATSYPIVLVKDPETNRFRSVAMLGLEAGENLYYSDDNWTALFTPLSIAMVPFALGLDPEKEKTLTACVDLDSQFIGDDKDLPLFDDKGEETELFKNIQDSLGRLYESEVLTERFIKEVDEAGLLEELELQLTLEGGEQKKLVGIYTISEQKLQTLTDEQVLDFHKRGLFIPLHGMLGSIAQINRLVQLRNKSAGAKIAGLQIKPVEATEEK